MSKVEEILNLANPDALASNIVQKYVHYDQLRAGKINEWKELRNYLFATDTKTTTNAKNGWKNSTTIPKLTQIRDNLLANYGSALFSSDDWLKWEAEDQETLDSGKARIIEDYVKTKAKESGLEKTIEKALMDYVDYGNPFAEVGYVNDTHELEDGEIITQYRGAKVFRISPYDHVFDATALSYEDAPKITRYVKSIGEIKSDINNRPDLNYSADALAKLESYREAIGSYKLEDVHKAEGFSLDGFGNYADYISSGYVEILEFDGDIHDLQTGELLKNQLITVLDRKYLLRKENNPSWLRGNKVHVGWRERPDNLYAMGALDNLVGMQYRLDHLENLKADAMDLTIHPPLKRIGEVEDFTYQPNEVIEIPDKDGDVIPMPPNPAAFQVNSELQYIEATMESMAGAPKEAMGIRTAGEKTAFEVQQLQNAAGRIFNDKIRRFEKYFLEPLLNNFLEVSRRNFDGTETIRTKDIDYGASSFMEITKEDITAKGKLRPIGSRHFAQEAQFLQNAQSIFNSPIGQKIEAHINSERLAALVSDFLGWDKYGIINKNAGIAEKAEQAETINSLQEQVDLTKATPSFEEQNTEIPEE